KVGAASDRGEGRQTDNLLADRTFGDFEFQRPVLVTDDRVAFVAEFMKISVVRPDVLRELELSNEAPADHKSRDAALNAVLRRAFWKVETVSRAPADHSAAVYVRRRIAWVHPTRVRTQRNRISMRVHLLVVEVVVSLQISPKRRIILVRRQYQRRAAPPATHEFRGDELLLVAGLTVLPQNLAKTIDMLLQPAIGHVAAVAGKCVRLRAVGGHSIFVRIAEDKFARLQRRA